MSVTSIPVWPARIIAFLFLAACSAPSSGGGPEEIRGPEDSAVATGDLTDLTATVPLLPPALAITTPERGAMLHNGDEFALTATLWDEDPMADPVVLLEMLSGQQASTPAADTVTLAMPLAPGIRLVQIAATDATGQVSREHRALRVGPFTDCATPAGIPDMAWDVGNKALSVGGESLAKLMAQLDFTPYVLDANPVYSDHGIEVSLETLEVTGLTITPRVANQQLTALVSLYEVTTTGTLAVSGLVAPYRFEGAITGLSLELWLTASVAQGHLHFAVDDLQLTADDITFAAWNAQGEEVIAPTEVAGAFLDFVSDTLTEALVTWVNHADEAAQSWLTGSFDLSFMGQSFPVDYTVVAIELLQNRLRIGFQANVDLPLAPSDCVVRTHAPPPTTYVDAFDVSAWFAVDFLNRLLIQLWAQGTLEWTIDQAFVDSLKLEMDLVAGLMGDNLRQAAGGIPPETPMTLVAQLRHPPEFRSLAAGLVDASDGPGLVVGGIRLRPYQGVQASGDPFADISLSLAASLRAEIHNNRLHLAPTLPAFALDVDGIPGAGSATAGGMKRLVEREVEAHFEALLPDALGGIAGALLAIPLPEAGGVTLVKGELAAQDDPGYLRISGSLGGATP